MQNLVDIWTYNHEEQYHEKLKTKMKNKLFVNKTRYIWLTHMQEAIFKVTTVKKVKIYIKTLSQV